MQKAIIISLIFLCSNGLFAHKEEHLNGEYTFIENKGQWNEAVKFKAEVNGATIYYENNAFHFQFIERPNSHPSELDTKQKRKQIYRGHNFKVEFINANSGVKFSQTGMSCFHYNYFIGNDKSKWKGKVKKFESIQYQNLYNGIDLISYQQAGFLKYDYRVAVGANPSQIKVRFRGVDQPTIKEGNLIIKHSLGEVIEEKPYAYQIIEGEKAEVQCVFQFNTEGFLGFYFPEGYNESVPLIIDPTLIFSTYSGSRSDNFGMTATYDNLGNGYMGGIVYGNRYDTTLGAFQTTFAGGTNIPNLQIEGIDISISKFSSSGNSLLYSTYLGGDEQETVHSMVVGEDENLYILGATSSNDFPTTIKTYDSTKEISNTVETEIHYYRGGVDIVVSKFSKNGDSLLGSTYYGGNNTDGINYNNGFGGLTYNYGDSHRGEIVLDSIGNCFIGSSSNSTNLNTLNSKNSLQDGLIVKFTTNLDSVIWARYIGGTEEDAIYSLKVIDNDRVLVGGGTRSQDFPITSGSYQDTYSQGRSDGFISIISSDGTTVEKSTFIGTSDYDQTYFIEFDRYNNIYALGQSRGGLFPIKNSSSADSAAGQFIIKLDRNLDSTIFSMTFGNGQNKGVINISPTAFLVDRCQNIYASGWGGSIISAEGTKSLQNNMPLTSNAFSSITDTNDFYLYAINRFADSVIYASYFGGTSSDDHVDGGTSRFDKQGVIYQSVCASCGPNTTDFPTLNAYSNVDRSTSGGRCNNALFKLDFQVLPVADFTTTQDTFCLNEAALDTVAITITNNSVRADRTTWDFYGTKVQTDFQDTTIYITKAGPYYIREEVEDTVCATGDFKETTLFARPDNINILTSIDTTICYHDSATIGAYTNGFANTFTWSKNSDFSNPISSNDSVINVPLDSGINIFYVRAENDITLACEKYDSIQVTYIPVIVDALLSNDTICENSAVDISATIQNVDRYVWDFDNGNLDSSSLSFTINYPNPNTYNISLEYENLLCLGRDTIDLPLNVIQNSLRFENLSDTLLCGNLGFRVTKNTYGTAKTYQWSSNANFSDTLNSNITDSTFFIDQSDSASYYILISNDYCQRIDSLNAEYIEYDLELQSLIDSTCTPYSTELQTTIIGTDSFRIYSGNGFTTSLDSTPIVNYPTEGRYSIQLIGQNAKCGIKDTITEVINVFQSVSLVLPNDTLTCFGDSFVLVGNTFGTANTFYWDITDNFNTPINPITDSTLTVAPSQDVTYYFKGQNVICDATDSINIDIEVLEVELEDLVSICLEDSITLEANVISSKSALNFLWSPNDSIDAGQGSSKIEVSPQNDMSFTLITTSAAGCVDFDTLELDVNIPAFTTAEIYSILDSLYKGQTTQLTTNRNGSNLIYLWEPDSGLNNVNSPSPTLKAIETKTYKVTITDLNTGCEVVAFKRIKVFEVNCGEPDIFIPSAFTPNNDLSNDILYVRAANVKEIDFQLYNRWGEKVFETKDLNSGWDGIYKGREVDPGVFVYHLKAVCFDDQEYFTKGDISLIR